jgi:DNA-binding winged helix-turn-helix (wHTH) protein
MHIRACTDSPAPANRHHVRVVILRKALSMGMRQLRFGEWIFEPATCVLRGGGETAVLEPRVADLLEFFVEHPGEVHTHDRLVECVWQGQIVSDEAVRRAVSMLRRAAGGALSTCIRTIYKRGYLATFPEQVEVSSDHQSPERLIRECDASLTLCVSMPSPGRVRTREALDCLRSALELDPRLLEVLSSTVGARYVR